MDLSTEELLELYETMVRIRRFEETAMNLFKEGRIRGPMHVYVGEEAVATGACSALREEDHITSTHRGHGHCIAKGGDFKKMIAELLGKKTGYSKGKGGSMHIADPDIGILGANGIVGGGIPIATGSGLSAKVKDSDKVTVCFFGDGASNQGSFHESLNLASAWNLPVIYICENNQYGLTSRAEDVLSVEDVADRAQGYDIPGEIVDGMDVLAVREAVEEAIERAQVGKGPTLIEAKTYRFEGHFVGDPEVYREQEEVEKWKEKCPIDGLKTTLLEEKGVEAEKLEEIEAEIKAELEEAVEFAKESPEPELEALYEDLFA